MLYSNKTHLSFNLIFIFLILFAFGVAPAFAGPDCYKSQIEKIASSGADAFAAGNVAGSALDDFITVDQSGWLHVYTNLGNGDFDKRCIIGPHYSTGCDYKPADIGLNFGTNDGPMNALLFDGDKDGQDDLVVVDFDDVYYARNIAQQSMGLAIFDKLEVLTLPLHNGFPTRAYSVTAADLNNDGYEDLIMGVAMTKVVMKPEGPENTGYAGIVVALNNQDGTFVQYNAYEGAELLQWGRPARTLAVGYLDEDPGRDVVFVNGGEHYNPEMGYDLAVLLSGNGDGTFDQTKTRILPLQFGCRAIAVVDIDNDNDDDILVGTEYNSISSPARLGVLLNQGTSYANKANVVKNTSWIKLPEIDDPIASMLANDVDGDGDQDLLINVAGSISGGWNEQILAFNPHSQNGNPTASGYERLAFGIEQAAFGNFLAGDQGKTILGMQEDYSIWGAVPKNACLQQP